MTPERTKRGPEREDKTRNVKQKRPLKPLTPVIILNMEPVKLEMYWTPAKQKEFRTAQMYEFLRRSDNLPSIEKELVEEYVRNYDPSDGSSVVNGRIIAINDVTLRKVLHLPICEIPVGSRCTSGF